MQKMCKNIDLDTKLIVISRKRFVLGEPKKKKKALIHLVP